jgi:Bacterial transcriptional activator domain
VDAQRFVELVASGRAALASGDTAIAEERLGEPLGLWRGPALADVDDAPSARAGAAQLEEARLAALESRIDAQLPCGKDAELIGELEALTAAHPLLRMIRAIDVRAAMPAIQVPTLVIQRTDDRVTRTCHGRYLADHLPHARYFEQPGDHLLWLGDTDAMLAEIEEFLTGAPRPRESERVLPRFSSPTSSTPRPPPRDWETTVGKPCSTPTTPRLDARLSHIAASWSKAPGTESSPPSTTPAARSSAPARSAKPPQSKELKSGPAYTPARSRCSATTSPASQCTSHRVSTASPSPAKSSPPAPSKTSS